MVYISGYVLGKFDALVNSCSSREIFVVVFYSRIVCFSDKRSNVDRNSLTSLSESSIGIFSIDIRNLSS